MNKVSKARKILKQLKKVQHKHANGNISLQRGLDSRNSLHPASVVCYGLLCYYYDS